jgi:large conductance mechanosensitive channel
MSILTEFKTFAMRGNVIDLAVGIIIGAAFGKIVGSFVDGILMPVLGLLLGGINIADHSLKIGDAVVKWGSFLQSVIDFTIIAFAVFMMIKIINKFVKGQQKKEEPAPSNQEVLLTEIRDLLKK